MAQDEVVGVIKRNALSGTFIVVLTQKGWPTNFKEVVPL